MTKSLSTVLLIFILLITFPIWIGIAGGLLGVIGGVFGAVFGVFAAIFGAIGGVFSAIFGTLFGWGHYGWPHWHFNGYALLAFIIVVALILSKRGKK